MAKDIHQNRSAGIQREILQTLLILVSVMTVLISIISIAVSISTDRKRLDQNLENVAQTLAQSEIIRQRDSSGSAAGENMMVTYLDSLKSSLSNIDVISIISSDNFRIYHTNHELIGTEYDGTVPDFSGGNIFYVASDTGPSGSQRRAYAAIYDNDGNYVGFVLAVMLSQNIRKIVLSNILVHILCAATVIAFAVALSKQLSERIKKILKGYEPDIFSAMFTVRDNVLEALEEGLLAFDNEGSIVYMNCSAKKMLDIDDGMKSVAKAIPDISVNRILSSGEKYSGLSIHSDNGSDILADIIPLSENEKTKGGLCILRDRTEFTKLMEDLSGIKYLVESMRANNHDFINKLHVILGLMQMNKTAEACEYIANITSIQQKVIHNIMKNIDDPSIAALLIGKYSRAAELDIKFSVESGSRLSRSDISLPAGDLITIIGNLTENAMDSLNEKNELPKELSVGIYTKPHAMIITVDDTGNGISPENTEKIFEYGYSTKGEGRGTGLHLVRQLIEKHNGTISVESEPGIGTSFTVTLTDERGNTDV
ncbi:MAG: ATP-binding protein [Eubacteriales bacterium]